VAAETRAAPAPKALVPVPVDQPSLNIVGRIAKFLQPKTSPALVPSLSDSNIGNIQFVTNNVALARQANANTYRAWASTPWVFSAINIRKNQIASADWDIVPFDNTKKYSVRLQQRIRDLFNEPSAKLDSFQSFASTVIDDILTLDAGVIEKVRYPQGDIAELWPTRGEWIAVDERWDGSDPEKYRYYFVPDGTIRAAFKNSDMVYMIANPRANSSVGLSPMAVLASTIDSELQAQEYNRRMVMGAAPDGALNIGDDASPEKVIETAAFFQNKIFGQSAMAVIGGFKNPSYMPFRATNRDMQFREWQDLLIRCIAVVLGLAPMDLGITFDVNRSTAEQGAQNTDDRGLRPLMALFQNYMTREIVWDKSFGGKENNLQFAFKALNLNETLAKANINKIAMPGVGWKSINDAKITDGRPPLGDPEDENNIFNHILIGTPAGMLDLNTQEYIGAKELADASADAQVTVAEAQGEIDAANADAAAQNAKEVAAASPAPVVAAPAKAPGKGAPK
jgi:HK97 family phage portal protein